MKRNRLRFLWMAAALALFLGAAWFLATPGAPERPFRHLQWENEAFRVEFSPDGRMLIASGLARKTHTIETAVWETQQWGKEQQLPTTSFDGFTPDGRYALVAVSPGRLARLDMRTWASTRLRHSTYVGVSGVIHPTGDRVAVASTDNDNRWGGVEMWSVKPERRLDHYTVGRPVGFSHDARWLAIQTARSTLQLVNLHAGQTQELPRAAMLTMSSRSLAIVRKDGGIDVQEVGTWKRIARLPAGEERPAGGSFTRDGQLLAVGHGNVTEVWDVPYARRRLLFPATKNGDCFALSPDGRTLAAGTKKGIALWRLPSLTMLRFKRMSR